MAPARCCWRAWRSLSGSGARRVAGPEGVGEFCEGAGWSGKNREIFVGTLSQKKEPPLGVRLLKTK